MKKLLLLLPIWLISGCSTLSESQCQSGDWYGIGQVDGSQGASLGKLGQHRDACGDYAIKIDGNAWRSGREQGLKRYCRPSNGYQLGRYGNSLNNVCPDILVGEFNRAYNYGNHIYRLIYELNELENRRELEEVAVLDETLSKRDRFYHLQDLKNVTADIEKLTLTIESLERRNPYSR